MFPWKSGFMMKSILRTQSRVEQDQSDVLIPKRRPCTLYHTLSHVARVTTHPPVSAKEVSLDANSRLLTFRQGHVFRFAPVDW